MYKLISTVLAMTLAGAVWAEEPANKMDNPKPLPDDVSLPLPCDGEMVFRYVYVLAQGLSLIHI